MRSNQGALHFISELIWREFYKYLFYHHPHLFNTEFQEKFRNIKWLPKKEALRRFKLWIEGRTGYTIVDAAMMQLAKSGVMHNRARMIVASVLTKNLGVDWRWGQEYFRAMLLDLDEASNNGGWQWGASVGADPKPIRIFNPYLQAENYDPRGVYQKKWLPDEYFQHPPELVIDHRVAREKALERYGLTKDIKVRDY
ncbi:MAG: FAD-binding domain-containing protein [Candidatus Paceibacterota bacterium]